MPFLVTGGPAYAFFLLLCWTAPVSVRAHSHNNKHGFNWLREWVGAKRSYPIDEQNSCGCNAYIRPTS